MDGAQRKSLLIAGIAPGLGLSTAEAFAEAGFDVIGLARSERVSAEAAEAVERFGGRYRHLICDLSCPDQVSAALDAEAEEIDVCVYNAHSLLIGPFGETTAADFERLWRVGCLGAMLVAEAVLPAMKARGNGTIIFTGATAGLRGGANFAAFASAKFALRGLAQALARAYGPLGVHVVHSVLDGLIDEPQTVERFGEGAAGQRMDPRAIADLYLQLAAQPPTAWTHELDLRPASECF